MDCLYGEVVKGVGRGCFTFPAAIRGAMGCLYGGVMKEGEGGFTCPAAIREAAAESQMSVEGRPSYSSSKAVRRAPDGVHTSVRM